MFLLQVAKYFGLEPGEKQSTHGRIEPPGARWSCGRASDFQSRGPGEGGGGSKPPAVVSELEQLRSPHFASVSQWTR